MLFFPEVVRSRISVVVRNKKLQQELAMAQETRPVIDDLISFKRIKRNRISIILVYIDKLKYQPHI